MIYNPYIQIGSTGGRGKIDSANLQSQTRKQEADLLNVSERSVNTAKKVEQNGTPELIEQVNQGNVSVSAAADVSALDKSANLQSNSRKQVAELQLY